MDNSFVWVEKYRPMTLEECVMPERIRRTIAPILTTNNLPHMLFSSPQGMGKTTTAKIIARHLKSDLLVINGSDQRNIDTLRTTIRQFVTAATMKTSPKIVLIDEADYLNAQSTQPALRNFIEAFTRSCRFIFTVNYPERIFKELKSRMVEVDFNLSEQEKEEVKGQWGRRLMTILENEGIDYQQEDLNRVLQNYFPDYRKTINELQQLSSTGRLIATSLAPSTQQDGDIKTLITYIEKQDFLKAKHWVFSNPHLSYQAIMCSLWDRVEEFTTPDKQPFFVKLAHDYSVTSEKVIDPQIHILAFLTDEIGRAHV